MRVRSRRLTDMSASAQRRAATDAGQLASLASAVRRLADGFVAFRVGFESLREQSHDPGGSQIDELTAEIIGLGGSTRANTECVVECRIGRPAADFTNASRTYFVGS